MRRIVRVNHKTKSHATGLRFTTFSLKVGRDKWRVRNNCFEVYLNASVYIIPLSNVESIRIYDGGYDE